MKCFAARLLSGLVDRFDTKYLFLALAFLPATAFARSKHAPLPDEVRNAKTIYLINRTGTQDVLDSAYQQFEKWGKYKVVSDKNAADLIIVFDHRSGLDDGSTVGFTQMEVFVNGSDEPAYETTEHFKPRLFGNSSTKSCVRDFEHRLGER